MIFRLKSIKFWNSNSYSKSFAMGKSINGSVTFRLAVDVIYSYVHFIYHLILAKISYSCLSSKL